MAKASTKNILVEKIIKTNALQKVVNLELSEQEARTLRTIFMHIGGSPDNSLRVLTNNIAEQLEEVQIPPYDEVVDRGYPNVIYFKSNSLNNPV